MSLNYKQELLDLLCIIHRDGGQAIALLGEEKALDSAKNKIYTWLSLEDREIRQATLE